jgi:hypothetical protein
MPLVVADRVRETTTTTGTGTITLAGAVTGYQSFSVIGNGDTTYYTINAGSQWEVGIGTYLGAGPTLSRDTVLESSNAGALVNFAAGVKDVFITYPAEKSVYQDGATIAAGSAVLPIANGGTNATTAANALTSLGAYPATNPSGYLSTVDLTTNVTGTLPVANGGTGASTLTANRVLLGNGTSPLQTVAPGAIGNILTSDGTTWTSATAASGGINYTVKTSAYTAVDKDGILANTTAGAFTITLPVSPTTGDQVVIADAADTWATNNLTVGRNGSTIEGLAEDLICNITGVSVQLIYSGATWQVYAQVGGAGGLVDINTQTTGTLTVSRGGTGATTLTANNVLLGNGTSALQAVAPGTSGNVLTSNGTTWTSAAGPSSVVQYPQNSQSADYTLVLGDAGKQIFHPASDTSSRTYTIPANASVAFPIGTVVLFTVENGGTLVNVAITSDTLVFGNGTTGGVLIPANQTLQCIKVTSTKWMANYLYQTGVPGSQTVAVGHATSPFITAYNWTSSGFGTKYTNPATLPAGTTRGVAFSPSGNAVAAAHDNSPAITAYPWSISGFGTKFTNPVTVPTGSGFSTAFAPNGNTVAVGHDTTPFVSAYPWSISGFGTKFTNPATLPTGTGNGVAFTPASDAIAVAHATTPFVSAYPWSGGGFGTKFTNPATLPASTGNGVAFSPSGAAIAVAHTTTPFITAYPWSGSGFGTKYANPATLPTGNGRGVAFNPSGDAIAVIHDTTPFVSIYSWSGSGFGTKFSDPATLPIGNGFGGAFSTYGDAVAVAHTTTPFVTVYPWSSSGFGTKYANPTTLPANTCTSVAFTVNP